MPTRSKLSAEDLQTALAELPDWQIVAGKLHRDYVFPTFAYAFGFMATAAPTIERRDHHPEWRNVYNKVSVDLITHDADGITSADIELAKLLEEIAQKLR